MQGISCTHVIYQRGFGVPIYLCRGFDVPIYLCRGFDVPIYLCRRFDVPIYLCRRFDVPLSPLHRQHQIPCIGNVRDLMYLRMDVAIYTCRGVDWMKQLIYFRYIGEFISVEDLFGKRAM